MAVSTAEKSDSTNSSSLLHLCKICHRMLLSNENALYEYRLLHTMAFRSSLLLQLWNGILTAKQVTSYAKVRTRDNLFVNYYSPVFSQLPFTYAGNLEVSKRAKIV